MAEPVTTSTGAAAAGLVGLLGVIFGPMVGGVIAVLLAAIAGVLVATASMDREPLHKTIWWICVGMLVALVLAWPLVPVVSEQVPQVATEHLPGLIGLVSGVGTRFSPRVLPWAIGLLQRWISRMGGGNA